MKKLTTSLFAIALSMLMFGAAYAESYGTATVPGLTDRYQSNGFVVASSIVLSNITDGDVEVTVDFYDQDGVLKTTNGTILKGDNTKANRVVVADNTNTFIIPAHNTRSIQFYNNTGAHYNEGYALVKWKSTDSTVAKALIGNTVQSCWYGNYFGWNSALINNGQPF